MVDDDSIIFQHNTLEDGYDFSFTDMWQQVYRFKIHSFVVPSGFLSEAVEVIPDANDSVPRRFSILSDFDADEEEAELKLMAKIKKDIDRKHLTVEDGKVNISEDQVLIGTIGDASNNDSAYDLRLEIDGKSITIEQFVDILNSYVGFDLKFEIFDQTDDIA